MGKFKNFSGSATFYLDEVVRSRLAEFAKKELLPSNLVN
jgi:PhoH-like ATPase